MNGRPSRRRISARWLFDGQAAPIGDGAVIVEGDRIVAVGPAASIPNEPDMEALDLGDVSLLPGLIDAHLHFQGYRPGDPEWPDRPLLAMRAVADARRVVESGHTTVRDCGSANGIALRQAIDEGAAVGPRVLAAGPIISQTGGHGDWHEIPSRLVELFDDERLVADGVDACRMAVRRVIRAGADFVKLCATGGVGSLRDHMEDVHFTGEELDVMVSEAHRAGRRVAAHAQGAIGIRNAVRAGVDTIEHGYFLDERGADEMVARGTALVPTFGLIRAFRASLHDPGGLPAWRVAKQRQCIDAMERSFPLALSAGIPIAAGSDDYGIPGRELGRGATEIVAMVEDGGMAPLDALRSATSVGARILGIGDETGMLAPGLAADLIAVRGTPWTTIGAVLDVAFVMRAGVAVTLP